MSVLHSLALAAALWTPPDTPVADSLRLSMNQSRRFAPGDDVELDVRSRVDGYLLVLHRAPDGRARVLYPHSPQSAPKARAGRTYEVRNRAGREELFRASGDGEGVIVAVVSPEPFRFDSLARDSIWHRAALERLLGEGDFDEAVQRALPALTSGPALLASLTYHVDRRYAPPVRLIHDVNPWGLGWGPGWGWRNGWHGFGPWGWW